MALPDSNGSSTLGGAVGAAGVSFSRRGTHSWEDLKRVATELRGSLNWAATQGVASGMEARRGASELTAPQCWTMLQQRGPPTQDVAEGDCKAGGEGHKPPVAVANLHAGVQRSPTTSRRPSVSAAPRRVPLTGSLCLLEPSVIAQAAMLTQRGLPGTSAAESAASPLPVLTSLGLPKRPINSNGATIAGQVPPRTGNKGEIDGAQQPKPQTSTNFSAFPWAPPFRSSRHLWSTPGSLGSQQEPPEAPHGSREPLGPPTPPQAHRMQMLGLRGPKVQHRASAGNLLLQRQLAVSAGMRRETSWAHFSRLSQEQLHNKPDERGGNREHADSRIPIPSWSLLTVLNFSTAAKAATAAPATRRPYSSDCTTTADTAEAATVATATAAATAANEFDITPAAASDASPLLRKTPGHKTELQGVSGCPSEDEILNRKRQQDAACAALESAAAAADSLSVFAPHLKAPATPPAAPVDTTATATVAASAAEEATLSNASSRTASDARREGETAKSNGCTAAAAAPTEARAAEGKGKPAATEEKATVVPQPAHPNLSTPEAQKGRQPATITATDVAPATGATATAEGDCTTSPRRHSLSASSRIVPPLIWRAIPPEDCASQAPCSSSRWAPLASFSRRRWKAFDMARPLRLKVVTIGPERSGKSCLVRRFCERRFAGGPCGAPGELVGSQGTRTIGLDFGLKDVQLPTKETVRLHFFDFSGAPQYAEAFEGALERYDVLLAVFDATDPKSLPEAVRILKQTREAAGAQEAIIALVAAKADGSAAAAAGAAAGEAAAAAAGARFYAACAETAEGVDTLFLETATAAAAAVRARAAASVDCQPQQQYQQPQ